MVALSPFSVQSPRPQLCLAPPPHRSSAPPFLGTIFQPAPCGEDQCMGVWGVWGGRRDLGYVCFLNSSPSRSYFSTRCPLHSQRPWAARLFVFSRARCVNSVSAQPCPWLLGTQLSQACQMSYPVVLCGCGFPSCLLNIVGLLCLSKIPLPEVLVVSGRSKFRNIYVICHCNLTTTLKF